MLAETILIALLIGLLFKGSLEKLSHLDIKLYYLPMIAFALEFVGAQMLTRNIRVFIEFQDLLTLITEVLVYCVLISFFYVNRSIKGMKILMLGSILNGFVIISNVGYMPVDPSLGIEYGFNTSLMMLESGKVFAHKLVNDATVFELLSDIIVIPPPWPFPKTISIGDIIMDLGVIILIFKGMDAGHTSKNSV